jgi:S1-C subfamily serine protease
MKIKILLWIFINVCFGLTGIPQTSGLPIQPEQSSFFTKAHQESGICQMIFVHSDGSEQYKWGCGFFVKGEYFATCYHTYFKGQTPATRTVIYFNYRNSGGKFLYDTITATLDKVSRKGQYDFSKHKFNANDFGTDFIVLRLSRKIKQTNPIFQSVPNVGESLYALGINGNKVGVNTVITPDSSISSVSFQFKQSASQKFLFIASVSRMSNGYSGTPVYNSKGEIIGIVEYEWPKFQESEFRKLLAPRRLSIAEVDRLVNSYKAAYNAGFKVTFTLEITHILKTYLKGYL